MSIKKDTFCVAPWYSIFVDSSGRLAPCCKFGKSLHNYDHIQKYFESPELEKVRQDLLNGVKNAKLYHHHRERPGPVEYRPRLLRAEKLG